MLMLEIYVVLCWMVHFGLTKASLEIENFVCWKRY